MFRGGDVLGTWTLSIEDLISGTEFGMSGDPLDYYGSILSISLKPLGGGDPPPPPPNGDPPPPPPSGGPPPGGDPQSTPEPGATALASAGLIGGALVIRRSRRPHVARAACRRYSEADLS
jgi:hypothetical protein